MIAIVLHRLVFGPVMWLMPQRWKYFLMVKFGRWLANKTDEIHGTHLNASLDALEPLLSGVPPTPEQLAEMINHLERFERSEAQKNLLNALKKAQAGEITW